MAFVQPPTTLGSEKIPFQTREVYFTQTKTITEGQILCLQQSILTASGTKGFGIDVEVPDAANILYMAGVYQGPSITGPAFLSITIPRKGDVMKVMISNSVSIAVGDQLKLFSNVPTATASSLGALGKLTYGTGTVAGTVIEGYIEQLVAIALDSIASTAAGSVSQNLKMVYFK